MEIVDCITKLFVVLAVLQTLYLRLYVFSYICQFLTVIKNFVIFYFTSVNLPSLSCVSDFLIEKHTCIYVPSISWHCIILPCCCNMNHYSDRWNIFYKFRMNVRAYVSSIKNESFDNEYLTLLFHFKK